MDAWRIIGAVLSQAIAVLALLLVYAYNAVLLDLLFQVGHAALWRLDGFFTESFFVVLAFSPPGQWVVGWLMGFRRPGPDQRAVLVGDLQRLERVTGPHPRLSLHVLRRPGVNAFVLGTHQLAVTEGFFRLSGRSREAVLAHELGHVRGRHAVLSLAVTAMSTVGNWFGYGAALLSSGLLAAARERRIRGRSVGIHLLLVGLLGVVLVVHYLLMGIVWTGCSIEVRRMEYEADAYAARCGFGPDLAAVLRGLRPAKRRHGILGTLWSFHPSTPRRLRNLARAMGTSSPF
jgi:Zn-dependent protease with chaperone function